MNLYNVIKIKLILLALKFLKTPSKDPDIFDIFNINQRNIIMVNYLIFTLI